MTAYEKVSLAIQSVGIIAIVATLIVYIRIHHTMVAQLNAALNASTEQLNKLQLEILQRSKERDAYVGLIDSILDLKRWTVDQRILMDGIREHDVFKQLVQSEVIGDEKELMSAFPFSRSCYHQRERGISHWNNASGPWRWPSINGAKLFSGTLEAESIRFNPG